MTEDTIIKIEGLSKKYRRYGSVAEGLKEVLHPFRKKYHKEFWALRDVSFELKRGESLGIVGRNGSGKSTLLQILCGVMQPTSGSVHVGGKVAALLELGAGFHPEFTGRENIFLQGALMGLTKNDIEERFDDIAAFADIGDFIEEPVRTYSSGMYVRLAFSAAINVDPDILVVDEALSVGDEAFQRKCYGRISSMQEKGVSIIFVSHAAQAITELCDRVLLFDSGELLLNDKPKAAVSMYQKLIYAPEEKVERVKDEIRSGDFKGLGDVEEAATGDSVQSAAVAPEEDGVENRPYYDPDLLPKSTVYYESHGAIIENPRITTSDGEQVNVLVRGEEYYYTYDVNFHKIAYNVRFGMMVKTMSGFELGGVVTHTPSNVIDCVTHNSIVSPRFGFKCALQQGVYFLNAGVNAVLDGAETYLHRGTDVLMFRVNVGKPSLSTGTVDFISDSLGIDVKFGEAKNIV